MAQSIFLVLIAVYFMGCQSSKFEGAATDASTKSSSLNQDAYPIDDLNGDDREGDDIVRDVVYQNPACAAVFAALGGMDLGGVDYVFNGRADSVAVRNGKDVTINGRTELLSVDGSKSVVVNGQHRALCLKSEYFVINGHLEDTGIPVVLFGQGTNAFLNAINGQADQDVVLVNIADVGAINGHISNLYVYGSVVGAINGQGKNLHLMNGSVVSAINGHFDNIYVYGNAKILNSNGDMNIIAK